MRIKRTVIHHRILILFCNLYVNVRARFVTVRLTVRIKVARLDDERGTTSECQCDATHRAAREIGIPESR